MEHIFAAFISVIVSMAQPYAHQRGIDLSEQQTRCLTEATYFESRGEGLVGNAAIAYVALNRAAAKGESVCAVVQKPGQFTYYKPRQQLVVREPAIWLSSAYVALYAQLGLLQNPIGNATSYNTTKMPNWTDTVLLRRINHHYFYIKKVDRDRPSLWPTVVPDTPRPLSSCLTAIMQHDTSRQEISLLVHATIDNSPMPNKHGLWSEHPSMQTADFCGAELLSSGQSATVPIQIESLPDRTAVVTRVTLPEHSRSRAQRRDRETQHRYQPAHAAQRRQRHHT